MSEKAVLYLALFQYKNCCERIFMSSDDIFCRKLSVRIQSCKNRKIREIGSYRTHHTIHNNLQICEFYIYKIHSCKMVMNSMIYFWQHTQKNNICSIVQRFPTTAMKIIFIIGWMAKQHTYNFVEQISNMSK